MYPRPSDWTKEGLAWFQTTFTVGQSNFYCFLTRFQGCGYTIERLLLLHNVTKKNFAKSIHENQNIENQERWLAKMYTNDDIK